MHPGCGPSCECDYRKGYQAAYREAAKLMGEMYYRFKRAADPAWEPGPKNKDIDADLVESLEGYFPRATITERRAALKGTTGSEADRLTQAIGKLGKA